MRGQKGCDDGQSLCYVTAPSSIYKTRSSAPFSFASLYSSALSDYDLHCEQCMATQVLHKNTTVNVLGKRLPFFSIEIEIEVPPFYSARL